MKKKFLIANWKMHLNPRQSRSLVQGYLKYAGTSEHVSTILCPSFTSLSDVSALIGKNRSVHIGVQDCFWKTSGSFTGEESPSILYGLGVRYVLIGHSERRIHLGETDAMVHAKLEGIMEQSKLKPILCIGENGGERKSCSTFEILEKQLRSALNRLKITRQFLIAYEPVWAIGSGTSITPVECKKIADWIRAFLAKRYPSISSVTPILYGGSVDLTNAHSIIADGGVDGLLVGSASLHVRSLVKIHDILAKSSF